MRETSFTIERTRCLFFVFWIWEIEFKQERLILFSPIFSSPCVSALSSTSDADDNHHVQSIISDILSVIENEENQIVSLLNSMLTSIEKIFIENNDSTSISSSSIDEIQIHRTWTKCFPSFRLSNVRSIESSIVFVRQLVQLFIYFSSRCRCVYLFFFSLDLIRSSVRYSKDFVSFLFVKQK